MEFDQRMYDRVKDIDEKVDELRRLLTGNGNVGLCEQVRQNKLQIGQLTVLFRWTARMFGFVTLLLVWHALGGDMADLPGLILKLLGGGP